MVVTCKSAEIAMVTEYLATVNSADVEGHAGKTSENASAAFL